MLSPQGLLKGIVSRLLPQISADGTESERAPRMSRYGEFFVSLMAMTKHPLAQEGTYFVAENPTLGTGAAGGVLAAFADATAAFVIQNTLDPSIPNQPNIDLDVMKLMYTVAPASATGLRYAIKLDNASRIPTAGFALLGIAQNVGSVLRASIAKVWAFTGGTLMTVPVSSGSARVVAAGAIGGLPVVGSESMVRFGDIGANSSGNTGGMSPTTPVSIPPGWFAVIYLWWPGNAVTGPSAEYEISWTER